VLCDLVPGGHNKEISAGQAAAILEQITPSGAVALARAELATEFLQDMRRLDAQLRGTRNKLATAVRASGTTLTEVFGVGPVIAGGVPFEEIAPIVGRTAPAARQLASDVRGLAHSRSARPARPAARGDR
jgi:hypothetical protein